MANGLERQAGNENGRTAEELFGILSDFRGDCRDLGPLHARYAASQAYFHLTVSTKGVAHRDFLLVAIPFGMAPGGACAPEAGRRWRGHLVVPRLVHTPEGFVNSLLVELDPANDLSKLFDSRSPSCAIEVDNHLFSIVAEGEAGARWLGHLGTCGYRISEGRANAEPGGTKGERLDDTDLEQSLAGCRIDLGAWSATMSRPEIARVRVDLAGLYGALRQSDRTLRTPDEGARRWSGCRR